MCDARIADGLQPSQKGRSGMKIADSNLVLTSRNNSIAGNEQITQLQLKSISSPGLLSNQGGNQSSSIIDLVAISTDAEKAFYSNRQAMLSGFSSVTSSSGKAAELRLIKNEDFLTQTSYGFNRQTSLARLSSFGQALPGGWSIEFSSTTAHYESEQMGVSARGFVTTGDGREISFSLDLGLSRLYASIEREYFNLEAALTDPLVINFQGGLPGLSDTTFTFDINNDGQKELIYAASSGSGFLALDLNNDGKINNGTELFGPASGNGFGELAGYDSDRNGWIDENDEIFNRLSIWVRDDQGRDKMITLREAGVGALSLSAVSSPFSLTDNENRLKGRVQSTGIYLSEEGRVGAMQQIDIAAKDLTGGSAGENVANPARQFGQQLPADLLETLANISRLAATASWLAQKSSEIRLSFQEELSAARKTQGNSKYLKPQPLDFIEQIARQIKEFSRTHNAKTHKYQIDS